MGEDYKIKWFEFWRSDKFRVVQWPLIAVLGLAVVGYIEPHHLGNVLLKLGQDSLFAYVGYWVDRSIFPYSRCGFGETDNEEIAAQRRRAIIIAACIVGGALAL